MKIIAIEECVISGDVKVGVIKDNKEINVYVQLVDGVHRKDLGCIVYTDIGDGELSNLSDEIEEIIKKAEEFMQNSCDIKYINVDYVYKIFGDRVVLSKTNRNFVNPDSSPYQLEYKDIKEFKSLEEAQKFFEVMMKWKN